MLRLAFQSSVSAVGIVDSETGELVANLSISDFRQMEPTHFGALALPGAEFLSLLHGTAYFGYYAGQSPHTSHAFFQIPCRKVGQAMVFCTPDTTYGEVLSYFVQHRIHHIYIIDEKNRPVGIITPTDVIRIAC